MLLKTIVLGNTALKSSSKVSFIVYKLRFFVGFGFVLPAFMTFFNRMLN